MGYETKLLIGNSTSLTTDEWKEGELIIENGKAYHPYLKDKAGKFVTTGRKETWFQVMTTIDLCKCGHGSNIHKIDKNNIDKSHLWYWYNGDEEEKEDCYGEKPKPVSIDIVLNALKKDAAKDNYRRFKWAVALLESMKDDPENLSVLLYGH